MQRKLSEIAEIPKILSSTLATMSQTFDKLMPEQQRARVPDAGDAAADGRGSKQERKYSYDEDAIDYELSDDDGDAHVERFLNGGGDDDGDADADDGDLNDEMSAQLQRLSIELRKRAAARQQQQQAQRQEKEKETTPESDYASEANYEDDEVDGELDSEVYQHFEGDADGDVDVDESHDGGDVANEANNDDGGDESVNKYVFMPKYIVTAKYDDYSDDHTGESENEHEDDGEEDFLTTTFTWNLRNVPKLQINDEELQIQHNAVDVESETNKGTNLQHDERQQQQQQVKRALTPIPEDLEKQKPKPDNVCKYERCWPWADREKIIYKQSTCHLVPRHKPLGLVEQRKQLLVKQNLMQNLQHAEATKK